MQPGGSAAALAVEPSEFTFPFSPLCPPSPALPQHHRLLLHRLHCRCRQGEPGRGAALPGRLLQRRRHRRKVACSQPVCPSLLSVCSSSGTSAWCSSPSSPSSPSVRAGGGQLPVLGGGLQPNTCPASAARLACAVPGSQEVLQPALASVPAGLPTPAPAPGTPAAAPMGCPPPRLMRCPRRPPPRWLSTLPGMMSVHITPNLEISNAFSAFAFALINLMGEQGGWVGCFVFWAPAPGGGAHSTPRSRPLAQACCLSRTSTAIYQA